MFAPIKIEELRTIKDFILVTEMNFGERQTSGGIVLMNDDSRGAGIRPRWGKVYAVGEKQTEVKVGQWVCVAHGRWTRGVTIEDENGEQTVRRIDNNDILLVSDEQPGDDTQSDAVAMDSKTRW